MTEKQVILRAENIYRNFPVGDEILEVLKGFDIEVAEGEMLVLLGPSGAGKSTLLHIIGLLDKPTSGKVFFRGEEISSLNDEVQSAYRNRHFGFIFQFYHLLPEFSAIENVLMPQMIARGLLGYRANKKDTENRAKQLLEDVGLKDRMKHLPSQLSGGERQRVAIARALINKPEIVFCDEPTGNLDSANASKIHDLLAELNAKQKLTLLFVTHNKDLADKGHRMIYMKDGKINPDA